MRVDWTIERVSAASQLPISLEDVKRRLNLPLAYNHHDANLIELMGAATEQFESDTDRICIASNFRVVFAAV